MSNFKDKLLLAYEKKIKQYEMNKNNYHNKKIYPIECSYCKIRTHIHNINKHLQTKKCQNMKELLIKNDPNIESKFKIELNNIKKQIKYYELNNDE